jgi:hypothetical protein
VGSVDDQAIAQNPLGKLHGSVHFKRFAKTPRTREGQSSPGSHPRTRKIEVRRDPMAASPTGMSEPVRGRELHPLKSSAFPRRTFSPAMLM